MALRTPTRTLSATALLAGVALLAAPRASAQATAPLINRTLRADNRSSPQNHPAAQQPSSQTLLSLQQAAGLANSGKYAEAMAIYKNLFGANPPAGEIALVYCETEAATPEGTSHAIATLRGLAEQFPADARYPIAIGRILAYTPETRAQGRSLLSQYAASDP